MNLLSIQGVSRTFTSHKGTQTQALLPVDFEVRENDFVTILGPSGCGKSTMLRIVAGLDFPTTGQVLLDGQAIDGPGADPTSRLDRVRTARPEGIDEVLRLSCSTTDPVAGRVEVRVRSDAAGLEQIKRGLPTQPPPVRLGPDGVTWTSESVEVTVTAPGATFTAGSDESEAVIAWDLEARTGELAVL